ncbi:gamma-glutamylcyclotransferase [Rhizobium leguminosarum]|uniref:gamma-glutamylcyclotransferase n=1 Tax=Rhizobium ruizarguesonis TaxID=2081791 RepID=UPI0013B8C1E7|nr:gamma-glutamylcyclotransferase [Rhizobium ruizarguesonis]NEI27014.1 gamma-glutamylcyclotransferase [Rhizobium ruizarguesonis]
MTDIREHKQSAVRGSKFLMTGSTMALTDELVSLSLRPAIDVGPEPHRKPLSEAEAEMLANRLLDESTGAPLWIFAYGSLIWKPDFDAVESQHGAARGWHRSFCLQMTRWRGTRAQPGLMMALDRGGRCNGVVFRLADDDRLGQIRRLIRREVGTIEDAATVRWIPVATPHGLVRALVFWAGPKGERVSRKLPLKTVAQVLARACGHMGSCAEYLYLTVKHLEERGIRDRNLWRLQKLVAAELVAIHGLNAAAGSH